MELTLSIKYGKYCLEIDEKFQGIKSHQFTNDEDKILDKLSIDFGDARLVRTELGYRKMYFDNHKITLKNYLLHKHDPLYADLAKLVDNNTKYVSSLKHINRKKLATMATIGSIALTSLLGIGYAVKYHSHKPNVEISNEILTDDRDIGLITPTITPTVTPTVTPTPTIAPTPTPAPTLFPVGDNFEEITSDFYELDAWDYIQKYSEEFGLDKYLFLAMGQKESTLHHRLTLPGAKRYNGSAVGIYQIEHPENEYDVQAFNYSTGAYEKEHVCMATACDLEKNIKIGAMLLQNKLYKYNNNIYIAVQAYNYGDTGIRGVLEAYAKEKSVSLDDVINNYQDIGWLKYVEDLHYHPRNYGITWDDTTYGDPNYIAKVLSFHNGNESTNKNANGDDVSVDLSTMQLQGFTR